MTESIITLRGVTLGIDSDIHAVEGSPLSARDQGRVTGEARVATIKTADGFHATIGVCM
jgi:hypothetical protein